MKVDIIIPTYNRLPFLKNCISSLHYKTKIDYNLYIIDDCSTDGTQEWLAVLKQPNLKEVILNKERRGLTFGFDILWDMIKGMNWFYGEKSEYLCLLQDDTEIMEENWLSNLIWNYGYLTSGRFEHTYNIGFFSGHDAPEHPAIEIVPYSETSDHKPWNVKIKKSMRATNIIGEWGFWESIGKVPRLQPNGSDRGFPSPGSPNIRGRGSNFDVYLTGCQSKGTVVDFGRTTKNSAYHQGKVCMIIPGLVKHIALDVKDSTWNNKNIE